MSSNITMVNDTNFETEVLQEKLPVLVDFWADWCNPCKMIAPILEDVAKQYTGKIKVVKMNVDESHDVPMKYSIRGIPTLIIFKDGNLAANHVGALSLSQLEAFIKEHI